MPVRMCVGCQEMKNKKEMIRVIKTPEGTFMLDATGKKNGRGAYVCPSEECLQLARKNKGLERSFKQAIPAEVYESLERRWKHLKPDKALSMLGIAARAGRIVSGEFTVEKEVKSGRAYLVLIAEDASENTRKKFQNMCEFYEVPMRLCYDRERLGHFIGK